ncbi:MAG: hypothetical protein DCC71_14965 [Proteobacteria bacterium]|nr:MAG: hypothetical protein DCC71_14965 [Pseudomonadota bacterium]
MALVPPRLLRAPARAYAAALLFAALAVAVRAALDSSLVPSLSWSTLFGAVAAAVWVGGVGPGCVAAVVGLLACEYLVVAPRGSLLASFGADRWGIAAYALSSGVVIAFGDALHRARRRAESLHLDVQHRLDELQALSDIVPAAVFVGDATARHIVGNRAAHRMLGVPEGSNLALGDPAAQPRAAGRRIFRDGRELALADLPMQRAAREGVPVHGFEHDVVFDDGRTYTILISATPLFGPDGRVRAVIGVANDISELHRSRRELAEIHERFEAFLRNAPVLAFLKDFAGRYVLVNRAIEELFETKNEDWIGHTDDEVFPPDVARQLGSADEAVRERESALEFSDTIETPAGVRQLMVTKFPVRDASGALYVGGVALDVTDRVRAEEALREAEQRFRVAQELSLDGFTILRAVRDARGRVADFEWTFANPAAGRLLRQDAEALVGRRLLEVLPGNRANSELFDLYVRVVETGEPHDVEVFYDSEGIRGWFRNMTVRLGDGVAVSFADITARKALEAELRDRTEMLAIADRRKTEFLAVLAHELRNPLGVVTNGLEYLAQHAGSGAAGRVGELMSRQLATMKRLVDDLLDANRIAQGKLELRRERIDVASLVAHAVEAVIRRADQAGLCIGASLPPEPLAVRGDPVRLAQALGNLLDNACKFTPPGGTIEMAALRDGADVVLRVRDDGAGIAAEELPRIFELFAQGDPAARVSGRGLGVGLALVRRLAEMHGGSVCAHSDGPGRGSTFEMRLPADDGRAPLQTALERPAATSSA